MTRVAPRLLGLTTLLLALACSGGDDSGATSTSTASTTDPTTSTTSASTSTTSTSTSTTSSTTAPETTGGSSTTAVDTSSTGVDTTGDPPPCEIVVCAQGKVWECGDCKDNDEDGLVDMADPECITPCDNSEASFATGLPGDNMDPCNQDCFFDGNSGSGDDKCLWNLKCDPQNPGGASCPYDANYKNCPMEQSQQCLNYCSVPNGCDCFGCCTIEVGGKSYDIYLGDPKCSVKTIESCASCTKNEACDNTCIPDNCELCFGQSELPPGCDEPSCDNQLPNCKVDAMGNDDCPAGTYCSTGCCVPIIPG